MFNGKVNNDVVEPLAALNSLRTLIIAGDAAARLQQLMPNCSVVDPSVPTDPADLRAAQWAVDHGATFGIHGSESLFQKLPSQPFVLRSIQGMKTGKPFSGFDKLNGIRGIDTLVLYNLTNSNTELVSIGKLETLRTLRISSSDVSAKGLEQLKELSQLQVLRGSVKTTKY